MTSTNVNDLLHGSMEDLLSAMDKPPVKRASQTDDIKVRTSEIDTAFEADV